MPGLRHKPRHKFPVSLGFRLRGWPFLRRCVARVECYKHGGKDLVGSDAYCMQATASVMDGMPGIGVVYYPVISWDKDRVVAADSSTARGVSRLAI
jgi:hypothetical protein